MPLSRCPALPGPAALAGPAVPPGLVAFPGVGADWLVPLSRWGAVPGLAASPRVGAVVSLSRCPGLPGLFAPLAMGAGAAARLSYCPVPPGPAVLSGVVVLPGVVADRGVSLSRRPVPLGLAGLPGVGVGEAVPRSRWAALPGADDGVLTARPDSVGAAGLPSAAISPVDAPDTPDWPALVGGCFGSDGAGIGRVGAAAARACAAFPDPGGVVDPGDAEGTGRVGALALPSEPLPGLAPDPGDTFGPDEGGTGRVVAAEVAPSPEAVGPQKVPGRAGVPEPAAGRGRVGASGPEVALGPDEAGIRSVAPASSPEPVPEPSVRPSRAGPSAPGDLPGSGGLGDDVGVLSAGAAGCGSAAASPGWPGFRAGLFWSFGSDTYNPSLGRNC